MLPTAALAVDPGALRDEVHAKVETILGGDGIARMQPIVDETKTRVTGAVDGVNATTPGPRQILSRREMFSMMQAQRNHTPIDAGLSDAKKAALRTYVMNIASAVAPILADAGAKEDANLSPAQRAALAALRDGTLTELGAQHGDALDAFAQGGAVGILMQQRLTPGTLAVAAELDLKGAFRR